MIIIGCDYHPGFQQIAFVDTETVVRTWASPEQALVCNKTPSYRLGSLLLFTEEFELAIMIDVVDRRDAWVGLSSRPATD